MLSILASRGAGRANRKPTASWCSRIRRRAVVALAAMGRFGEAFARGRRSRLRWRCRRRDAAGRRAERGGGQAHPGGSRRIRCVPEQRLRHAPRKPSPRRSEFGFPVVAKILSPDILHKSEIGGVLLNLGGRGRGAGRLRTLLAPRRGACARPRGSTACWSRKQVKGGVEMAIGVVRDPVFGPVAMVGLGGVFIEVLQDVAFRRCPVGEADAEAMIRSLRGFALLDGARGRPKADVAALARALAALSRFAHAAGPRLPRPK